MPLTLAGPIAAAGRLGEGRAGGARRDELDPGRREPSGAAGGDRDAVGLRGAER